LQILIVYVFLINTRIFSWFKIFIISELITMSKIVSLQNSYVEATVPYEKHLEIESLGAV
jgi:hypothetical protein